MGTYNVLHMRGYLQKFLFIKPQMIHSTVAIEQQFNRQVKRMLWYTYSLLSHLSVRQVPKYQNKCYIFLFYLILAGRFCIMGATSWSIQDIQLSLEKLCASQWSFEALCFHGYGNAWMHTFRNSGKRNISFRGICYILALLSFSLMNFWLVMGSS